MCFPTADIGLNIAMNFFEGDLIKTFFSENPGVVIQVENIHQANEVLKKNEIRVETIGEVISERVIRINRKPETGNIELNIDSLRATWYQTSFQFDKIQRPKGHAEKRKENIFNQRLHYQFQPRFDGKFSTYGLDPKRKIKSGIKAAIIREKGVNSDREMAYALYLAGFDVKDVHMTDLVSGREDLSEVNLIVFVGGFSNSDVLGAAKGWAGAFLYNPKAKAALDNFYKRDDTLSLGVCNGCQLMMELGLLYPEWQEKMHHNDSGKFECTFLTVNFVLENNSRDALQFCRRPPGGMACSW